MYSLNYNKYYNYSKFNMIVFKNILLIQKFPPRFSVIINEKFQKFIFRNHSGCRIIRLFYIRKSLAVSVI